MPLLESLFSFTTNNRGNDLITYEIFSQKSVDIRDFTISHCVLLRKRPTLKLSPLFSVKFISVLKEKGRYIHVVQLP